MRLKILTTALMLFPNLAIAQAYPTKPILFVIPYSAGGDSDLSGRNVAHHASKYLNNRPIVSLNRVGGAGAVGSMSVKNATPDGYTLLVARVASHAVLPATESTLGYKWNDFTMISMIELNPTVCFVKGDSGLRTIADLIAAMRKAPGKINYGNGAWAPSRIWLRSISCHLQALPKITPLAYLTKAVAISPLR